MAAEEDALTPEQIGKVQDWFRSKWTKELACPVSGDTKWIVAERLVCAPLYTKEGTFLVSDVSYPMVMVVCSGCGYARFFSAAMIGIVPATKEFGRG
jgi:hypothetical protein